MIATRYGLDDAGGYDGTIDGEFVWGPGQARRRPGLGRAPRHPAAGLLRLLRQLLRHPAARRGGQPDRGQPRHPAGRGGRRPPLARPAPRRAPRRAQAGRPRAPAGAAGLRPPRAVPVRPLPHRGRRAHPVGGSAADLRQPPQLLRPARHGHDPLPRRVARCASSARRRSSTPRSSATSPRRWAASAWTGAPARTSRWRPPPRPCPPASSWRSCPRAPFPGAPRSSIPALKGRWGAARLAAQTRVPVIPVGLWGTEKVWPRNARLPDVLNITDPPDITVTVGPPVELSYEDADPTRRRSWPPSSSSCPPRASEHHEPTGEELARTYPSGWTGDPDAEVERRPGTD